MEGEVGPEIAARHEQLRRTVETLRQDAPAIYVCQIT